KLNRPFGAAALALAAGLFGFAVAGSVNAQEPGPRMDIYGFAMLDTGYDFKQVNPDWFDVVRPTKLPAFDKHVCDNGNGYAGVRRGRLGVKGYLPRGRGEVKRILGFELSGTGVEAGQTPFRLRHAWGEIGQFERDRPGARSWIPTSSRIRSSTGGLM